MQPLDSKHEPGRLNWLAKMYRAYAADLQRYIYSKVGDPFLAEDLTSTVFLKALRWLREDQSEESARGWLYATARTSIADAWQASGQYETLTLTVLEDQLIPQLEENADFVQQQAEARVQHLLSLLSERERRVLTLRYLQGYSATEIALALGTNAGHIRVLQLRALKRAAQLEKQERNIRIMQEQEGSFDSFAQLLNPASMRVLALAYEEALNLKHNFIGTEHLLWGLASEGSLASFLTPLNITPERIHTGIVFIYNRQAQWTQSGIQETSSEEAELPSDPLRILTPRTRQGIVLAGNEMKSQGEQSIRPTHLLLGLINEGSGIAVGLLRSLGVSFSQVRSVLTPPNVTQICSFCSRSGYMVKRIFIAEASGDTNPPTAFICDQCVEQFHALLAQF